MDAILKHWNALHVNMIALKYLLNYALDVNAILYNKKKNFYRYQLVNKLLFELQKRSIARRCQENNIKKGYALFRSKIPFNNQINDKKLDLIINKLIIDSLKRNEKLKKNHEE